MPPRAWSLLIIVLAIFAGVAAVSLGFEPCLASLLVVILGLTALSIVVTQDAKRKLAASRIELMREAQMCPACGYTIRAKTDRCPECGTPVVAPRSTADDVR